MSTFVAWLMGVWRSLFGTTNALPGPTCIVPWKKHGTDGIWYMGSTDHRAWQKRELDSGDAWSRLFAAVSGNEGSSSAYQNYDNQGVTLGAGFGARGMLGSYAKRLALPELLPVPDEGNKYSKALIERMRAEPYGVSYVCAAESGVFRERVLKAQIETFKASKASYALPLTNFPLSYLLSHLAHWYPAFVPYGGWTGTDSIDVPRVLAEFRTRAKQYGVTPSETQIGHYISTYRKLGGTFVH